MARALRPPCPLRPFHPPCIVLSFPHPLWLQAGPTQVFLSMQTPVGPIAITESVTPLAPARQRVMHAVFAPPYVPRIIAKVIMYATVWQVCSANEERWAGL